MLHESVGVTEGRVQPRLLGPWNLKPESILERCAEAGARSAGYILLRLPHEVKDLFGEWLEAHYPLRASHVLSLVRQTRGGRLYDGRYGARMRGVGAIAGVLRKRFEIACRRLGLSRRPDPLDVTRFRLPPEAGDQPSLFPPRGE